MGKERRGEEEEERRGERKGEESKGEVKRQNKVTHLINLKKKTGRNYIQKVNGQLVFKFTGNKKISKQETYPRTLGQVNADRYLMWPKRKDRSPVQGQKGGQLTSPQNEDMPEAGLSSVTRLTSA